MGLTVTPGMHGSVNGVNRGTNVWEEIELNMSLFSCPWSLCVRVTTTYTAFALCWVIVNNVRRG